MLVSVEYRVNACLLLQNRFGGNTTTSAAIGGLSVTGCLSDFSVYIFHPYGGKKSGNFSLL